MAGAVEAVEPLERANGRRAYAVGDVHGCHRTLRRLLSRLEFNPDRDRLRLTGDLVNRGPRPLETLRACAALGPAVTAVLGNHDLHALALALGVGTPKPKDDFDGLFQARDRDDLLTWLRARPLLHREDGRLLVHAGLLPEWSLEDAVGLAAELEAVLRGPLAPALLRGLYQSTFPRWDARMDRLTRMRLALSAFTRMRCVDEAGRMAFAYKGPARDAPAGLAPWYARRRERRPAVVVFGHWSALGFAMVDGAVCLDGGCYAGGALYALRLGDGAVFRQPNVE